MNKIIIIDGVDGSGKTSVIDSDLKDIDNHTIHFPSKKLISSIEFTKFLENSRNVLFLDSLVTKIFDEMYDTIYKFKDTKKPLIIDRFIYSTAVYQGFIIDIFDEGLYNIVNVNLKRIERIFSNSNLQELLLNFIYDKKIDIFNIIFTQPILNPGKPKIVTNKNKKLLDSKSFYYRQIWNMFLKDYKQMYSNVFTKNYIYQNRTDKKYVNDKAMLFI